MRKGGAATGDWSDSDLVLRWIAHTSKGHQQWHSHTLVPGESSECEASCLQLQEMDGQRVNRLAQGSHSRKLFTLSPRTESETQSICDHDQPDQRVLTDPLSSVFFPQLWFNGLWMFAFRRKEFFYLNKSCHGQRKLLLLHSLLPSYSYCAMNFFLIVFDAAAVQLRQNLLKYYLKCVLTLEWHSFLGMCIIMFWDPQITTICKRKKKSIIAYDTPKRDGRYRRHGFFLKGTLNLVKKQLKDTIIGSNVWPYKIKLNCEM